MPQPRSRPGLWRARGPRRAGGLPRLAARTLHQRRRHSGRWRPAALRILRRTASSLPLGRCHRALAPRVPPPFQMKASEVAVLRSNRDKASAQRRSTGTRQLSTRWASDALSDRRSFNVCASWAMAGGPAMPTTRATAAPILFTPTAPCEGQIDAAIAGQRIVAVGQRRDAVINQPIRTAPNDDVAALQRNAPRPVAAAVAAEQEYRRQSERNRDDRRGQVALVLVPVQRQSCPGLIQIYQAGVRLKAGISCRRRRARGKVAKGIRHWGPGLAGDRVDELVAISLSVCDPAGAAAIGHPDRHPEPARGDHVAKRRASGDLVHRRDQRDRLSRANPRSTTAAPLSRSTAGAVSRPLSRSANARFTREGLPAMPWCPAAPRQARN